MTSDPTSWTELKASLANWLNRDDLSAIEIPEAIALAERRFQRIIFAPEREIGVDLAIAAEEEPLPADLWAIRALHLDTDPKSVLEPMTPSALRRRYPGAATGTPRAYALHGEVILFAPAPDTVYVGKLSYIQTIPALGASQPSNWLLTDHPDLYLYGALRQLHLLTGDSDNAERFEALLRQAAEEVNDSSLRRSRGGPSLRIRPPSHV